MLQQLSVSLPTAIIERLGFAPLAHVRSPDESSHQSNDEDPLEDSTVHWASLLRRNLGKLSDGLELDEECYDAPHRSGGYRTSSLPAARVAELIYPSPTAVSSKDSSDPQEHVPKPPTKYYQDVGHLKSAIDAQRRAADPNLIRPVKWSNRIKEPGPWDEEHDPLSTDGVRALPMPVKISDAESLEPFFSHLSLGGNHQFGSFEAGKEPYYAVDMAEFEKGVLYADGRMDLCKEVLGPPNIGSLMQSLEGNTFVKHFLLGNNIIGPTGAYHIASFVDKHPTRIETWYLAGNCIDSASFKALVHSWVRSPSITNVWLKRNPLGPSSVPYITTLIKTSPELRTLDLDETELGDLGVASLFTSLHELPTDYPQLPLHHLYLNAVGISVQACHAIGKYLASPTCALQSLYMSNNPIGDPGALAIAAGLKANSSLRRLVMSSCGLKDLGATSILEALVGHSNISYLDLAQSFSTSDLGMRYNYLIDEVFCALSAFIMATPSLRMLNLGTTAMSRPTLERLATAVLKSSLSYNAGSIHPKPSFPPAKSRPSGHLAQHLVSNVKMEFGSDMTYQAFEQGEMRFLKSPRDVRLIDSVYRNRDAGDARRGKLIFDKWWPEGDGTIQAIMEARL